MTLMCLLTSLIIKSLSTLHSFCLHSGGQALEKIALDSFEEEDEEPEMMAQEEEEELDMLQEEEDPDMVM
jgi:hypothetical protein